MTVWVGFVWHSEMPLWQFLEKSIGKKPTRRKDSQNARKRSQIKPLQLQLQITLKSSIVTPVGVSSRWWFCWSSWGRRRHERRRWDPSPQHSPSAIPNWLLHTTPNDRLPRTPAGHQSHPSTTQQSIFQLPLVFSGLENK